MGVLIIYPGPCDIVTCHQHQRGRAGSDENNQFLTVSYLRAGELQVILNKSNVLAVEI